jgi:hypothetical protein
MNDRGITLALGGFGLAVITVGVVGAAFEWELGQAGWFLLAGCALIALALLHPRLTSVNVEVAGTKIGAIFTAFATEAGSVAAIEIERLGMADLAIAYQFVHDQPPARVDKDTRIRLQDTLIDQARTRRVAAAPRKRALKAALHGQSDAARAIALGVAQGHPELVSLKTITPNITASLSANEQYQAIRVVELMVPTLTDRDLRRLRQMLVSARYISDDEDSRPLRDSVVAAIDARLNDGSLTPVHR